MLIMSLDLATKTGFCISDTSASKPTRSGSIRLKDGEDEPERAFRKLGIWLRDQFSVEMPDLVVCEAPVNLGAFVESAPESERGFRFRTNPSTVYLLSGLVAVTFGICGPYGVRCVKANVQTVRKHFVGVARPPDPKKVVIARCQQLRWVDATCRDDNQCDALAAWSWAAGNFGSRAGGMFDHVARLGGAAE